MTNNASRFSILITFSHGTINLYGEANGHYNLRQYQFRKVILSVCCKAPHIRSYPNIIRICGNHFIVVMTTVSLPQSRESDSLVHSKEGPSYNILLSWDIFLDNAGNMDGPQDPMELNIRVPEYQEKPQERKARLSHMALIMKDIFKGILELGGSKTQAIDCLLHRSGAKIPITEGLVTCAAGYTGLDAYTIMKLLFRHRGGSLPISEEVIKAVARNTGSNGYKIIKLVLQHQIMCLPISEEVVRVAAGNAGPCGYEIIKALFQRRGTSLPVSEKVVKAAAGNIGPHGHEIVRFLFQHQGMCPPISEEVVKAAAENTGPWGYVVMEVLYQHRGASLPISEEVVKAVAENTGIFGYRMREFLSEHRGASLPISQQGSG